MWLSPFVDFGVDGDLGRGEAFGGVPGGGMVGPADSAEEHCGTVGDRDANSDPPEDATASATGEGPASASVPRPCPEVCSLRMTPQEVLIAVAAWYQAVVPPMTPLSFLKRHDLPPLEYLHLNVPLLVLG